MMRSTAICSALLLCAAGLFAGCHPKSPKDDVGEASTAGTSEDSTDSGEASTTASSTGPGSTCGNGVPDPGELCHKSYTMVGFSPIALGSGDFDGDGRDELTLYDDARVYVVRLSMGMLSAEALPGNASVSNPRLHAGDLVGDGGTDLIVAGGGRVKVFERVENGFAEPVELRYLYEHGQVALGTGEAVLDADGNGTVEVFAEAHGGAQLWVAGGGDMAQAGPPYTFPVCGGQYASRVADFDGDGLEDIAAITNVFCDWIGNPPPDGIPVKVFLGREGLAMADMGEYPAGGEPRALVAGDVDGDGFPDVVVLNWGTQDLSMFRGLGNGMLSGEERIGVVPGTFLVFETADLDGDGTDEILFTENESLKALSLSAEPVAHTLWAERARAVAVLDINGDGLDDIAIDRLSTGELVVWVSDP